MALPLLFRRRRAVGGAEGTKELESQVYRSFKTPAWAPPSWAFPVAWTLNTVALAATAQHLLVRPHSPRRNELLAYLGLHTALYATFSRVYFDERSPVLAAVWTLADFAVCHVGFYRALGPQRLAAMGFVPVNLWLTVAAPLALYQAGTNRDPYFGELGIELQEILAAALDLTPLAPQEAPATIPPSA